MADVDEIEDGSSEVNPVSALQKQEETRDEMLSRHR